jgi:rhodanese-related sulfurtransferase
MKLLINIIITIILLNSSSLFAEIHTIDTEKLKKLISDGIALIDIRTEQEWIDTGVIEGSNLITFFDKNGNFNTEEWLSRLQKIATKTDPVIIICRSGRRSNVVANYLDKKKDYLTVYDATEGIKSWINAKNIIVKPTPGG